MLAKVKTSRAAQALFSADEAAHQQMARRQVYARL